MSGFTDGLNSLGQMGDSFLHGAEKASGEVIDAGAHVIASGLNEVGLHSWATSVTETGDSTAASLGATVPEQQLGESGKPSDLIHGDVKAIRASAQHLHRFATAFDETGKALKDLDTGHWRGEAADAFRESYTPHPAKWIDAADACTSAATALDSYADTVEWAQGQAAHAITVYNAAQQASQSARTAYNRQVEAFNAAAERGMTVDLQPPAPFHDPGQSAAHEAREILTEARRQRDSQAEAAQRTIAEATKLAPTTPSFTTRLLDDYADGMAGETLTLEHVGGGIIKGLGGMLKFAHGLDPTNPYNLANPGTYLDHITTAAAGLLHSANHPVDLVKGLAGSGWTKDPGEAFGRLLANVAIGTLTDGAGETADIASAEAKNVAERTAPDAAESAERKAAENTEFSQPAASHDSGQGKWSHLAQASDGIQSKAIHADSVDPSTAQAFLDDQYPWMREINRPQFEAGMPGHNINCSENVIAVDKRLNGIDAVAPPLEQPRWPDPARLGNPKATWHDAYTYDNIIQDMKARGEGSRGVVYIGRSDNTAHVFNVIHDANGVVFLDGQIGKLAQLELNATSIQYMPYR